MIFREFSGYGLVFIVLFIFIIFYRWPAFLMRFPLVSCYLGFCMGKTPKMLKVLADAGVDSFYRNEGQEYLGADGQYHPTPLE